MKIVRRLVAAIAVVTSLLGLHGQAAIAQEFPNKPIRFIVPFPPGGGSDIVARLLAEQMQSTLGQPVTIENLAGAAGAVGLAKLARSEPDGYTIGWGGLGPTVLAHIIGPKPQYDRDDLVAFARTGAFHYAIVGRPDLPYNSLGEVIDAAKKAPNTITYATSGRGGPVQLAFEFLRTLDNVPLREVPFKGDPESLLEIMAGRIDLGAISVPAALPQIKAGKVKALAVPTESRLPFLPDVPTTAEAGSPGFLAEAVGLLLVPAGTPKPVIERLNEAANAALRLPSVTARFAELGLVATPLSSDESVHVVEQLTGRWTDVIKKAGIPTIE